ncbi:energy-coupling factor ABC transporter ATP-binding protein [Sedimenticola hydrogenitrophicus]|uniref:energy-coupling factor ABC transporter ATP-binding protein n=1 Tax=Sedimenticola hydrogenitrophicus TaxID=2967975 RepID=UPI0023AE9E76|nr:ABC transporter ATP-binding protein [Sedimenticola hydrogenitrophicus]
MNEILISLQDIAFGYPAHPVLSAVNFHLHPGERVALLGENGAGKTTLLQLMVGLHKPSAGRIHAFGRERRSEQEFREVRARAGLLFQDADDQLFCPTVLEDVIFGPLNLGRSETEAREIAEQVLDSLGLSRYAERVTHKLSGGEKRMVALATVLAMQPQVLLMDEPTNGLDEKAEQRLLEHLESLPQAMVFVSHDRKLVERLATRAVLIQDGTLVEGIMHRHPHLHTHSHLHVHAAGIDAGHEHDAKVPEHKHSHGEE